MLSDSRDEPGAEASNGRGEIKMGTGKGMGKAFHAKRLLKTKISKICRKSCLVIMIWQFPCVGLLVGDEMRRYHDG